MSVSAGIFAPASPKTIWKRQAICEEGEARVYQSLLHDSVSSVIPQLYREVEYNGSSILLTF